MATIKHIGSKNADYGAAEAYLTFQHDEFTMKPTLDENGRMIPREDYRLSTLECSDEDFAIACLRANARFKKNNRPEDIKSHHYIISFDPRDGSENGLTLDRAQELGVKFCAANFPGHQALVCTHPDGHNHSGNIHVHIVINSIRIREVEHKFYMDRVSDTRAGDKHRCTAAAFRYLRSEVMELCQSAGLYQIDLLIGSKTRVTEREYWAKKKGQLAIDRDNEKRLEAGEPLCHTKFETEKEKLRQTIRRAIAATTNFEDFAALLMQEGITIKESRGRLSYLTPERTKPITARKLGDDFAKSTIFAALDKNAQTERVSRNVTALPSHKPTVKEQLHQPTGIRRVTDVQQYIDAGKSRGYVDKVKISNLKKMAASHNYVVDNGYGSITEFEAALDHTTAEYNNLRAEIRDVESKIAEKKKLSTALTNYRATVSIVKEYYTLKGKKQQRFRDEHDRDFTIFEGAKNTLAELGVGKPLPSGKAIKAEIDALYKRKSDLYAEYNPVKEQYNTMTKVSYNLNVLLHREQEQTRKKDMEL